MVTSSDYNKYQKLSKETCIDQHILFLSNLHFKQTQEKLIKDLELVKKLGGNARKVALNYSWDWIAKET